MRKLIARFQNWFARKSPKHLRHVRFSFDGQTITAEGPFAKKVFLRLRDIDEIGIETSDTGPIIEDLFWLINRDSDALRIPQDSPVFRQLMDHFGTFPGFNWQPFIDAMSCTDQHYFQCWRKRAS